MRLLWITEHYAPGNGGMARSCDRIVHGLRETGKVEIDLVHLVANSSGPFISDSWRTVQGGRECQWPISDDRAHDLRVLAGKLERSGSAKGETWDVVVAFGGTLPVFLAPVLARWIGKPSMTLLRGNDFDTAVFSTRRQAPLLAGLKASTVVCPVTRAMAKRVRALLPDQRVEPVANGIDPALWPKLPSAKAAASDWRESRKLGDDEVVIGLIGQLKRKKGVDAFVDAVARSEEKVHLMLLGSLDASVNAALARHHNDLSYSRFPAVAPGGLIPFFERCDFVGIPSLYDGMPNVLLEAGVLGIPAIAADSGGMPEIVGDGGSGLLFDPYDPDAATAAIVAAARIPAADRETMGRCLRERIITEFTAEIETRNYLKLLDNLTS